MILVKPTKSKELPWFRKNSINIFQFNLRLIIKNYFLKLMAT